LRSLLLIIFLILALSSALFAAQTATVTAPEAGDYYYWIAYDDVNGKPVTTTPTAFEKKATVDLPLVKDAVPPKSRLFVLDAKTGTEAIKAVEGKPPYKYELKTDDFKYVRRLRVAVSAVISKYPAAAGIIKLVDADKNAQTQTLDPTMSGVAQFTDVPSGTAKVTVEYDDGKSLSQDVDITLDNPSPIIQILVSGNIDTLKPAQMGEKTPPKVKGESKINFAMALVGLIVFVGVVWLAVRMMASRGAGFRQILKKVGVDLPEEPQAVPAAGAPTPVVDPTICPFCGNKKDPVTGACACTVGAGSPGAAAPAAGSGPRLVATQGAYAGSIYPLAGDEVVIGREETNTIAFPQESTVSRRHARITNAGGQLTIRDEGSSNGVFVNGVKVTEQALHPGDEVQIGNTRLRFEV